MILQSDATFIEAAARASFAASVSTVVSAVVGLLSLVVTAIALRLSARATAANERATAATEFSTALSETQAKIAARSLDLSELQIFGSLLHDVARARRAAYNLWRQSTVIQEHIRKGVRPNNIHSFVEPFHNALVEFIQEYGPSLRVALARDQDAEQRVVDMLSFLEEVMRDSRNDKWVMLDSFSEQYRTRALPDRPGEMDQLLIEAREILKEQLSLLSERVGSLQRRLLQS